RPAQARGELGRGPVLAFATRAPIGGRQISQLKNLAGQLRARLLVLPMVAGRAEVVRQPEALIRAVLAAVRSLPAGTIVIPVPYAERDAAMARELAAIATIAPAYGATHLIGDGWHDGGRRRTVEIGAPADVPGAPIPVLRSGDWAYDPRAEVWRPLSLIEAGTEIEDLTPDQLADMLDTGAQIPPWFASEAVAAELR